MTALLFLPPGTRADLFHARRQLKGAAKSLQNAKGGLDERRSERVTQMQKELAALLARIVALSVPQRVEAYDRRARKFRVRRAAA